MKKVIWLIIAIVVMFALYKVGTYASKAYWGDDSKTLTEREVPKIVVDNETEEKISNITQLIMQKYDSDNNILREEIISTPIEYFGYTREQLMEEVRKYMINPSAVDKTAGINAYELVSFSKNQVTLRKSYSLKNLPTSYYISVENGYLTIYLEDKSTIYDYTEIRLSTLPESVQQEIIKGLSLKSQKELYEFLETYTS